MPRGSTDRTRPQCGAESILQSDDRDDVRPALASKDICDGLSVDAAGHCRIPQAPALGFDPSSQCFGDVLDDACRQIIRQPVGPPIRIEGVLTGGGRTAQSSWHWDALLTITAEDEGGYLASRWEWIMYVDAAVAARIRAYRPTLPATQWARLRDAVLTLVIAVAGRVPYDVDDLLHVTTRIAQFADEAGLPADPAEWLRAESIDRFIITGRLDERFGPSSALTYRTYLRRMREALVWVERGEAPSPKLCVPVEPSPPYSQKELSALDAWGAGLPDAQRHNAAALLCLGSGCGLARADLIKVRGDNIQILGSGAVLVSIPGAGRIVVCRARYEERLAELAGLRGPRFLFRPDRKVEASKNLTSNWTAKHRPPQGSLKLSIPRLRSTWIVALMTDRVDRDLIAVAAGLNGSAQLAKYARWVPPITADTATRLLRGSAWD